ncbi:methyltransferase domain-containing protein [Bacillus chungangensis]|uniref:methyltransferase domain-containing protein n=1 Tax=Bacillus chungangensis TaxID=587633 RepID=UPI0027D8E4DB|nr:class I SAM-dependent methyltransferase [Bacillus chungangensis]
MIQIAKNKTVQLELESRVRLIQGTMDDLNLSESKYDAASCILVLYFVDDVQEKLKLLRTIRVNLKSGALFVFVSAYGDRDDTELQDRLNVWKSFFFGCGIRII